MGLLENWRGKFHFNLLSSELRIGTYCRMFWVITVEEMDVIKSTEKIRIIYLFNRQAEADAMPHSAKNCEHLIFRW